jgi:hypothetical protein
METVPLLTTQADPRQAKNSISTSLSMLILVLRQKAKVIMPQGG